MGSAHLYIFVCLSVPVYLSVDCGLHEFVEEALTENAATGVENMLVVVHNKVDGAHLRTTGERR